MQVENGNVRVCRGSQAWRPFVGIFVLALASVPVLAQQAEVGWPRTIQSDGQLIQVYQPQVDKWESGKLEARAAVVVTRKELGQPIYGVVWLSARTTVDQQQRLVTLYDIEVTKASFPAASAEESKYVASATAALAQWTFTIGLDRLLADLAITQTEAKARGVPLGGKPPKIFVRTNPAVLILIDGEPVLRKVEGTNLMRVINSPAVIVLDPTTTQYFLRGDGYWMTAANLNGPWTKAAHPPDALASVLEGEEPAGAPAAATPAEAPPEIIVSTEPAELIQLRGEEQYSPISGTKLLYVTNTDTNLFMNLPDQRYYVLLSGRWFRSQSLDGPWEFVAGKSLPADFAAIPPGHAKATVLASVPGTRQAQDAIVAAQVPQTATINRKLVRFKATYDGAPQFKPIEGTDLSYAVNSPDDIILVEGRYYALHDGVWFVADNAQGPWAVCAFVPPAIYSIPPTSPLYPDTFAYVYEATPEFVYVGYLPGYFGAYIWDGAIVYGTGFWYPCWAYDFWYPCPWTWGFGWQYAYWGWGFRWRPWYPSRWYWRPWRGRPAEFPRWSQRAMYNRPVERTATAVRMEARNAYDRWTTPGVISHHPVPLRAPAPGRAPGGVAPPRAVTRPPTGAAHDIYAGPDGHVYEYGADGWYRREGGQWQRFEPARPPEARAPEERPPEVSRPPTERAPEAARPAPPPPSGVTQQLERQRQARIEGARRETEFHRAAPSRPSAPSGGARGGGGGGGRGGGGGGRR